MRNLTQKEIDESFDSFGFIESEGYTAIESTIGELATLGVGTACGTVGNQCFDYLASKGYKHRKVRGWLDLAENKERGHQYQGAQKFTDPSRRELNGGEMILIKIQTETTAEKIERLAGYGDGSLRFNAPANLPGYMEFETE
jgi:hypothetical protein